LLLTKSQIRPKPGVQYFGIQVRDLNGIKKRLQEDRVKVEDEGQGIRMIDPEGNHVLISQSGWSN
jgi:hypothetical protein